MLTDPCARHVIESIIDLYPNVKSALNFKTPFELTIAVLLSAQTTDKAVNQKTPLLFERFPTAEVMAQSSEDEIIPYIQSLGLYKNKSRYMLNLAKQVTTKFNGQIPKNRKDLESLSGIGRKSASVILSVAFDIPAFAVDTHVSRVCKHHHIAEPQWNTRQIEDRVCSIIPKEKWKHAHQAMILFGREICHPKNPICDEYPELYQCLDEV